MEWSTRLIRKALDLIHRKKKQCEYQNHDTKILIIKTSIEETNIVIVIPSLHISSSYISVYYFLLRTLYFLSFNMFSTSTAYRKKAV